MSRVYLRPGDWLPGPEEEPNVIIQAVEDVDGDGFSVLYGPARIFVPPDMMPRLVDKFPHWIRGHGIPSGPLWEWWEWNLEQRIALLAAIGSPRSAAYVLACLACRLKADLPREILWKRWGRSLLLSLSEGLPYSRDPAAHQMACLLEALDLVGQCAEGGPGTLNVSLVPLKYACARIVEANIWSEQRLCMWIMEKYPFASLTAPWRAI